MLKTPAWHLLSWLLDDPLAPPQIEWLQRISWGSGLNLSFDLDRLYLGLTLSPDGTSIVIKDKAAAVLENIIQIRYLVFERVLRHHTVRSANLMLINAFADLALHGCDLSSLPADNDMEYLSGCYDAARHHGADRACYLINEYRRRQLFKRLVVIDPILESINMDLRFDMSQKITSNIEDIVAEEFGIQREEMLIDLPRPMMLHPEILILSGDKVISAENFSPVFSAIIEQTAIFTRKITLYCSLRVRDKLGGKSEHISHLLRKLLSGVNNAT
jgi:HD superfamily phosphohydrolase